MPAEPIEMVETERGEWTAKHIVERREAFFQRVDWSIWAMAYAFGLAVACYFGK